MATKYQPLVDHLAAQTGEAVTLSFVGIEETIGFPLPETMRTALASWTSVAYVWVWQLKGAGWRARLDRQNQCVHFTREE